MKKSIGVKVNAPKKKCEDKNCPFHGSLSCRGMSLKGTVVSDRMRSSAVVELSRKHYLAKYERSETRRTKIKVHNPGCINAKQGDVVKIMECRPLSKTKHFVIIENLGQEKGFKERIEALEEAKVKEKEKEEKDAKKAERADDMADIAEEEQDATS